MDAVTTVLTFSTEQVDVRALAAAGSASKSERRRPCPSHSSYEEHLMQIGPPSASSSALFKRADNIHGVAAAPWSQCVCPDDARIPCDTSHLHAPCCAARQLACGPGAEASATRTLRKPRVKSSCFVWKDLVAAGPKRFFFGVRWANGFPACYIPLNGGSPTPLHYPLL